MTTTVFYRQAYSTLTLTLVSNEELGLLDTDYLEDYNGVDGQLTLHHVATDTDYTITMVEQVGQTPGIPHDYFSGTLSLSGLPDGTFEVRGRCRDSWSNYSILNEVATPLGGENIREVLLLIITGSATTQELTRFAPMGDELQCPAPINHTIKLPAPSQVVLDASGATTP